MLIDFTVENFRSIKEPVTLSAVAQKTKTVPTGKNSTRFITPDDEIAPPFAVNGWNFELLPALAIFGANASGKSNLLNALGHLLDYMVINREDSPTYWEAFQPFMLAEATLKEPIRFELRAAIQQTIYTYTLHLGRERILLESLYSAHVSTKRDRLLYQRAWNEGSQRHEWKNGKLFSGPHTQLQANLHERDTLMSLLTRLNVSVLEALKSWLSHRAYGLDDWLDDVVAIQRTYNEPDHLAKISAIVRRFDTGINRVEVSRRSNLGGESLYEIFSWHKTKTGEVKFPWRVESSGTKRLFTLADKLIKSFDTAGIIFVDELGSNIHPHITREIVRMFQSPKTNPKRAQLIFTSHDNTLQRNHLLRRDQIWFTQKRLDGSTELYPLTDFKPRNDMSIDRSYFDGRYGAVPFIDTDEEELAQILAGAA